MEKKAVFRITTLLIIIICSYSLNQKVSAQDLSKSVSELDSLVESSLKKANLTTSAVCPD